MFKEFGYYIIVLYAVVVCLNVGTGNLDKYNDNCISLTHLNNYQKSLK